MPGIVEIVGLVVPELISCLGVILSAVPDVLDDVVDFIATLEVVPDDIQAIPEAIDFQSRISQILNALASGVGSVMDLVVGTVSSVFSGVVNGLLLSVPIASALYRILREDLNKKPSPVRE